MFIVTPPSLRRPQVPIQVGCAAARGYARTSRKAPWRPIAHGRKRRALANGHGAAMRCDCNFWSKWPDMKWRLFVPKQSA